MPSLSVSLPGYSNSVEISVHRPFRRSDLEGLWRLRDAERGGKPPFWRELSGNPQFHNLSLVLLRFLWNIQPHHCLGPQASACILHTLVFDLCPGLDASDFLFFICCTLEGHGPALYHRSVVLHRHSGRVFCRYTFLLYRSLDYFQ